MRSPTIAMSGGCARSGRRTPRSSRSTVSLNAGAARDRGHAAQYEESPARPTRMDYSDRATTVPR
jgi:hypothetical protein